MEWECMARFKPIDLAPSVFDTGTQAVPFYQETQNPGQILGGDQSQPAQLDLPEGATLLGPTNGPDGVTAGGIPIINVNKYTVPEGYYTYDAADGNTYAVPLPSGTGYDQAPIGGQPMPSGDSMGKGGAGNDSLPAFTDPLGPTPTNDGFNPTNDGSSSSYPTSVTTNDGSSSSYPTNVGSYPGSFGGGYGGYGGGGYYPIVLDLTGKGINIQQLSSSNTFFDMAGEGHQHLTAWAGAGPRQTRRSRHRMSRGRTRRSSGRIRRSSGRIRCWSGRTRRWSDRMSWIR